MADTFVFKAKIPAGFQISDLTAKASNKQEVASNLAKVTQDAIDKASINVANQLALALDKAMASSVWKTPNSTGDIIDTGELMRSRNVTYQNGRFVITYSSPYFGIVHFGGYIQPYGNSDAKKVYIPARPWIASTLGGGGPVPAFDFGAAYRQALANL